MKGFFMRKNRVVKVYALFYSQTEYRSVDDEKFILQPV